MDRFNANKIIAIGFVLTAFAIYAIGQVAGNLACWWWWCSWAAP